MNQTTIGSYIARKRREQNLTQEQLAQQLGVSNKTISKWENGKCMPDYSIIQKLCDVIHVSLPELMDGEDAAEDSVRVYDDEQILDLLRRTQELERQKGVRDPHGSVRRRNSGRHLDRRKEALETIKKHRLLRANRSVQRRRCVYFVYCFGASSSPRSHAGSVQIKRADEPGEAGEHQPDRKEKRQRQQREHDYSQHAVKQQPAGADQHTAHPGKHHDLRDACRQHENAEHQAHRQQSSPACQIRLASFSTK